MIRLSVPLNFNDEYIRKLKDLNTISDRVKIKEAYGALDNAVIGHLRPSRSLSKVNMEQLKYYIDLLHECNIEFGYIMNSTVIDGLEYTVEGKRVIVDFVKELVSIGVDSITVTIPYIIKLLKRNVPGIKLTASICSNIDSIEKAKRYVEAGAESIVIHRDLNRNFKLLKNFVKSVPSDFKLLCTTPCILKCPDEVYHGNFSSVRSTKGKKELDDTNICHAVLSCSYRRLSYMEEHIKSPWIRPEDMKEYEQIGLNYFKIDGRDKSAEYNLLVIESYIREEYDGNLLYLMKNIYPQKMEDIETNNAPLRIGVNNKDLNNFLRPFIDEKLDCSQGCDDCGYCKKIAEKFMIIDKDEINALVEALKEKNSIIESVDAYTL